MRFCYVVEIEFKTPDSVSQVSESKKSIDFGLIWFLVNNIILFYPFISLDFLFQQMVIENARDKILSNKSLQEKLAENINKFLTK